MPCCQIFEPRVQSGHRLASLGFSKQQNMHTEAREGSQYNYCWVKEYFQSRAWQGQQFFCKAIALHLLGLILEKPLK